MCSTRWRILARRVATTVFVGTSRIWKSVCVPLDRYTSRVPLDEMSVAFPIVTSPHEGCIEGQSHDNAGVAVVAKSTAARASVRS